MNLRLHLSSLLLSAALVATRAEAGPHTGSGNGQLQVFSAMSWESRLDSGLSNSSYVHSEYLVLTPGGKVVLRVGNAGRTATYPDPDVVSLAPGSYRVSAQAAGRGRVEVPVTITAGHKTVIHLEKGDGKTSEKVAGR